MQSTDDDDDDVSARVEVDTVFELAFGALRMPGLYPQGAEKDYRTVIGRLTKTLMLSALIRYCNKTIVLNDPSSSMYYTPTW